MTSQKILEKAIQKAIDGEWSNDEHLVTWKDGYGLQKLKSTKHLKEFDVEHIIYDKNFAKALWGEGQATTRYDVFPDENGVYKHNGRTGWKLHLQQMVIAEDPIKYLGENL